MNQFVTSSNKVYLSLEKVLVQIGWLELLEIQDYQLFAK